MRWGSLSAGGWPELDSLDQANQHLLVEIGSIVVNKVHQQREELHCPANNTHTQLYIQDFTLTTSPAMYTGIYLPSDTTSGIHCTRKGPAEMEKLLSQLYSHKEL